MQFLKAIISYVALYSALPVAKEQNLDLSPVKRLTVVTMS